MTIDEAIDELKNEAILEGVQHLVQGNEFSLGPYTVCLTVEGDTVRWRVPAIVGGLYIYDQEGEFTEGMGPALVAEYAIDWDPLRVR